MGEKLDLRKTAIIFFSVVLGVFHLYTAAAGNFTPMLQRPIHLTLVLLIVILAKPAKSKLGQIVDALLILGTVSVFAYNVSIVNELNDKMGIANRYDVIAGVGLVIILLEVTRRSSGNALPIVALAALAYIYVGPYLPGVFGHPGYSFSRVVSQLYLGTEGIWGTALSVSATYLALFIFFGSFLQVSGGGQFFVDIAVSIAGAYRGGPAKTAVIGSGLMGSISGSPVANVVTVGAFTIPLMKKIGYSPVFAGGVEAVASAGGSIMPPVMGAGAFVMAEMTGIPYTKILAAAVIPALMYYAAVFMAVDFEAGKRGLLGMKRSEIPKLLPLMKERGYLLLPLVIMIYMMTAMGTSVAKAGFFSILSIIALSFIKKATRFNLKKVLDALIDGSKGLGPVATACATAGVVTGVISLSGIGLKFTQIIVEVSNGNLYIALILTMIGTIIMGMGLPPTPTYIIMAALGAPALTDLGVSLLVAHMFIFFFSVFAPITPPVALAAYAASGIAGGDPFKTGWQAFILGLSGFIIPYVFIMDPSILLEGTVGGIILQTVSGLLGIFFLSQTVIGWFGRGYSVWQRLLLGIAAISCIVPGVYTDLFGTGLGVLVMFLGRRMGKRQEYAGVAKS